MDTNVIIDFFAGRIPQRGMTFISSLPPIISVVTEMEVLGWYNPQPTQLLSLEAFVNTAIVIHLDRNIINQTIQIRQTIKTKLPDAIIGATALIHNHTLLTRNESDFRRMTGLNVINPHTL